MATKLEKRAELEANLPHFTGTEEHQRLGWLGGMSFLLTDGVAFLVKTAESYWLMDAIASYQREPKVMSEGFQTWKLAVEESGKAVLTCDDGDGHILARQEIDYTSFPLPEITLYVTDGDTPKEKYVILPSEY